MTDTTKVTDNNADVTKKIDWEKSTQKQIEKQDRCSKQFSIGVLILKRYRIIAELGRGGMGIVYLCYDEVAGIEVALKCLPPELSHNTLEMEAIKENFQLVTTLNHPNIAAYKQLEQDPENGDYYLIMEYVKGESLGRWIRQKRRENSLTFSKAQNIIHQVADALDYAHQCQIIHRDIKPGNIMIDEQNRIKVLDFGLAAQIHTSMSRVNMEDTEKIVGTPPYMSPEQWCGKALNAASDQYALAVMAYEMFAGHLPFDSSDLTILKKTILTAEPEKLKNISGTANSSIRRAMNKDASKRFSRCTDFADALAGKKSVFRKKIFWGVIFVLFLVTGIAAVKLEIYGSRTSSSEKTHEKEQSVFYEQDEKIGVKFNENGTCLISYPENSEYDSYKIPDGITILKSKAFSFSKLEQIILPSSLAEIEEYVFEDAKALKEIVIPKNVRYIGAYAFASCFSLKTVTMDTSSDSLLTRIEDGTFNKCRTLQKIDLPPLAYIGRYAFALCENMETATLRSRKDNPLKEINVGCFFACRKLKSVKIPDSVTKIEELAFGDCNQLDHVVLPATLTSIERNAFNGCSSLKEIAYCNQNSADGVNQPINGFPPSLEYIGINAFKNCHALKKIDLPQNVNEIGMAAFENCILLESISLPSSLKKINVGVFRGCQSLREVNIPSSVTDIDDRAFAKCVSLISIKIPASVKSIGIDAFDECSSLRQISIPAHFTDEEIKKWRLPEQVKIIKYSETKNETE